MYFPIISEKEIKNNMHNNPRQTLEITVIENICFIFFVLPQACASDMVGIIKEAADPVNAHGNMISGNAIPENVPYIESASVLVKPLFISIKGRLVVSIVDKRLIPILFKLRGKDILKISIPSVIPIILYLDLFCIHMFNLFGE